MADLWKKAAYDIITGELKGSVVKVSKLIGFDPEA